MDQTQSAPATPAPSTPAPVAAPAAPVAPSTESAATAAVKSGNTQAYRAARRAERSGKPLEPVTVAAAVNAPAPEAAPATPAPTTPTAPKRGRDEEYISTRIREGVDHGTRELRAEIDRMKAELSRHAPAQPAAPQEQPKAYDGTDPSDPKPQAVNYDDHDSYLDDRDAWNERRIERKQAAQARGVQVAQERQELTTAQQARVDKFITQLDSARAADAEFVKKLTPDVLALKPFGALVPGEVGGAANVVAEQVYDSPIAPQVLLHFSQHPDALARLIAMPPEIQSMPAAVRTSRHIQWIVKEFGKVEAALSAPATESVPAEPKAPQPQITAAPAPARTLGSRPAAAVDPKTAAVKSGNTQAYREIRRAERAAQFVGRR